MNFPTQYGDTAKIIGELTVKIRISIIFVKERKHFGATPPSPQTSSSFFISSHHSASLRTVNKFGNKMLAMRYSPLIWQSSTQPAWFTSRPKPTLFAPKQRPLPGEIGSSAVGLQPFAASTGPAPLCTRRPRFRRSAWRPPKRHRATHGMDGDFWTAKTGAKSAKMRIDGDSRRKQPYLLVKGSKNPCI